jgi:hypothetical protein
MMRLPLALVILFMLLGVSACNSELTLEQQIIEVVRDMESRIEAGERRPFMEHVSDEFIGQWDTMNRDQLNAFILFQLHRHERVHAQLLPIHVTEVSAGMADAHFRALLTGGPGNLPDSGRLYEISTRWRKQEDEWMLISASWTPVDLEDVLGSP